MRSAAVRLSSQCCAVWASKHMRICSSLHFFQSQREQLIDCEVLAGAGFTVFLKGAAQGLAQIEEFGDAIGVARLIVLVPVLRRDQTFDDYIQSGFFLHFLDGVLHR